MATVELYQDDSDKKEWRWRVIASNGKILGASSEGFARKSYAENNLRSLPFFCLPADVKVASEFLEKSRRPFSFYKDKANEWRWCIKANNDHITHASSEGFSSKQNVIDNITGLSAAIMGWDATR